MSWENLALCREAVKLDPSLRTAWDNIEDGEEFTSDPNEDTAKTICAECPVRRVCLEDAVNGNSAEGIRGGYRFHMGTVTPADARELKKVEKLKAKYKRGATSDHAEYYGL